ncbi:hypothetical protein QBC47DRAFT_188722 [Echria macrotheca]|uniref:Fungal N-terminal domain-containing protein n=1 Tax=Echria macrotheca TaxID=438768 RepID=A0AAJ0BBS7_9PEZI|nr:hypothetical protein QBC47DRAFT_188722 [Echria macrotheca]
MEALAVAASIVGLVSLAIQLTDKLWVLTIDAPFDQRNELSKTLTSSISLLKGVEDLASKSNKTNLSSQSRMIMHSLALLLEDYTEEMKEWHRRASRLLESSGKWSQRGFSRFMGLKSRYQRTIKEGITFYEDRIGKCLAIIGRELDFDNNVKLDDIHTKLDNIILTVTGQASEVTGKLEKLSSSGDSVLSHAQSTDRKLDDVSSGVASLEAEFRELKTALLDFVSSSSASTSQSRGDSRKRPKHQASVVHANISDDQSQPESQESGSHGEPEFEPLLNAANALSKMVQVLYPPLVSDYVATLLSWQLLARFNEVIHENQTGLDKRSAPGTRLCQKSGRSKVRKRARQLLALRKFCLREGLSEAVVRVEEAFGVNEEMLAQWAETEGRDSEKKRKWMEMLTNMSPATPEDRELDWATRINSWLFRVFEAYPEYSRLHRNIYAPKKSDAYSKVDDVYLSATDEQQQKIILRYWFLDSARTTGPDSSQSSVPDTDATIQPSIIDVDNDFDISLAEEASAWTSNIPGRSHRLPPSHLNPNEDGPRLVREPVLAGQYFEPEANFNYYQSLLEISELVPDRYKQASREALSEYGGRTDDLPVLIHAIIPFECQVYDFASAMLFFKGQRQS